jgi:hypothetical protein
MWLSLTWAALTISLIFAVSWLQQWWRRRLFEERRAGRSEMHAWSRGLL